MIPLYLDEDSMDRDLITALRARGVDVITAADTGMLGRSDEDHLEYAIS
jgi:post-segregation antitoxin (ccd killing protein)